MLSVQCTGDDLMPLLSCVCGWPLQDDDASYIVVRESDILAALSWAAAAAAAARTGATCLSGCWECLLGVHCDI